MTTSNSLLTMSLAIPGLSGKGLADMLELRDTVPYGNEGTYARLAKFLTHQRLQYGGQLLIRVDDAGTSFTTTYPNDSVSCTATITFAELANNETTIFGGLEWTFKSAGGTGEFEVLLGADETETAATWASKINASATCAGRLTATSALGVVTATLLNSGSSGVFIRNEDASGGVAYSAASFANGGTYTRVAGFVALKG